MVYAVAVQQVIEQQRQQEYDDSYDNGVGGIVVLWLCIGAHPMLCQLLQLPVAVHQLAHAVKLGQQHRIG